MVGGEARRESIELTSRSRITNAALLLTKQSPIPRSTLIRIHYSLLERTAATHSPETTALLSPSSLPLVAMAQTGAKLPPDVNRILWVKVRFLSPYSPLRDPLLTASAVPSARFHTRHRTSTSRRAERTSTTCSASTVAFGRSVWVTRARLEGPLSSCTRM